jgi:hypothetical protein
MHVPFDGMKQQAAIFVKQAALTSIIPTAGQEQDD